MINKCRTIGGNVYGEICNTDSRKYTNNQLDDSNVHEVTIRKIIREWFLNSSCFSYAATGRLTWTKINNFLWFVNTFPITLLFFISLQSLEKRVSEDEEKLADTEDKVNTMEDAGVLPRDGFAGTLNNRCEEVKKEQEAVKKSITEAKTREVLKIYKQAVTVGYEIIGIIE